ncbi:hypothetical protein [Sphingobacterium spiritivorum]|uniref:hypothetical protein n=1 Tax=Sphingobacterium spiritivorum TaxID=258 RepID=UPI003DA55F36
MAEVQKRDYQEWLKWCDQVQRSSAKKLNETPQEKEATKKMLLKDYNLFFKTVLSMYCDDGKTDCADFQVNLANKVLFWKRPPDNPNLMAAAEWPREHAKSVHIVIGIPMFMIANGTMNGMILMGKNENDACNLLADLQAQLQYNELFAYYFGEQYNAGSWSDGEFTTREGIRFLAIGRDQTPRGARKGEKRPNYAAIDDIDDDDIVHNQKRVKKVLTKILGALFFALDTKKGGTLIMAGNRIHAQSILAHFVGDIKPGAPKRKGIYHSKIFAIDPKTGKPSWSRYTLAEINSKIEMAGTVIGRREFFHENHVEGEIFKDKMLHWIKMWHLLKRYKIIIGYFDPSFENNPKSDFKAVRVWGGFETASKDWQRHCIKSFVRRSPTIDAFQWMSDVEDKLPAGVAILWYMEKQFFNKPLKSALAEHNKNRRKAKKRELVVLVDCRSKENKYVRIVKMEPSYSNNENYFNLDELHNADMIEGNNQLKGIEPGYNSPDDSPDADEGAFYYLDMHKPDENFDPIIERHQNNNGW